MPSPRSLHPQNALAAAADPWQPQEEEEEEQGRDDPWSPSPRRLQPAGFQGTPWGLLFFLLAFWVSASKGAPVASHVLQGAQDLQLWNEIDDVCSSYLTGESPHQSSNSFEEICFMVLEFLQKAQELDEKDITKRSSVLHPLLQLVPQLERRLKRYKEDDELRIPGGIQSRGYFIFRPRNGRRSATLP
ncbi:neuromedin-U isoform X2 [Sceloporus undulatus]|uniref:neuromedin-U isoform X2 n=1 Tax=Sceloporus undulatus TaxID=8520 RepID=UPI001C4D482F|nr:neuromedin-U isoform X2 [Sceloporus undulatus]